jgi:chromosome segregation ATPase
MATTSPQDESAPAGQAPKKKRNHWIWISAVLAIAAIGLLIWALQTRSDLNAANDKNDDLQAQVAQGQQTGSDVLTAAKDLINNLAAQLGAANEDLADTQGKLDDAQAAEEQAQKDAEAAKKKAEQADNATDKANAEADQAKAEAQAVESKASIAAECAKAYVSAFGSLIGGEGDQATLSQQLAGITDQCKAALEGT